MLKPMKLYSILFFCLGSFLVFNGFTNQKVFFQKIIDKNLSTKTAIDINYSSYIDRFENPNSSQINNLYSEKEIALKDPPISEILLKNIFVKIKPKPINPSIIKEKNNNFDYQYSSIDFENIDLSNFSLKKQEFIKTLLPLVSYENQKIFIERKNLENLKTLLINNKTLSNKNLLYLNKIAKNYKIDKINKHKLDLVNELLLSVDIIPNAIVLAQAANESGWGTSRFAKEYNALFGEYTYDFSNGVVPLRREVGAKHLVKSFTSVDKSVQSYFKNLNTHYAYKEFRYVRKIMRDKNNFNDIDLLVDRLSPYALDEKYIETIKAIIESNNLQKFDFLNYTFISS